MPIWKLKNKRFRAAGSDWKPHDAGKPTLWCNFITPTRYGFDAIAADDGTLKIHVQVAAAWERTDSGPGYVPYRSTDGFTTSGITDARISLRRGTTVWMQHAGWVRLDPMMALRQRSVSFDASTRFDPTWFGDVMDGTAEISGSDLGPGPVTVIVYIEGHPRNPAGGRRYGTRPKLAGTFSAKVMIDGEAPDTFIDEASLEDRRFTVEGRASDNHEVEHVRLVVTDDVTGKTLNQFGYFKPYTNTFEVPVDDDGTWSWTMPELMGWSSGNYSVVAQAEDTAQRDQTRRNKQRDNQLDPTPARVDVDT